MMAATKTKQGKAKEGVYNHIAPVFLITGIAVAVIIAALMLLGLMTYSPLDSAWHTTNNNPTHNALGTLGAWYSDITLSVLGYASYLIPVGLVTFCVQFWLGRGFDKELFSWRLAMLCLAIISGSVLATKYFTNPINEFISTGGGYLGQWLTKGLESSVSSTPVIMLLTLLVFILSITILFSIPWLRVIEGIGTVFSFALIKLFARKPKAQTDTNERTDILKSNAGLLDDTNDEPEPYFGRRNAPTISRYQGETNNYINSEEEGDEEDLDFGNNFRPSLLADEDDNTPKQTQANHRVTATENKQEPTFFDFAGTHEDTDDINVKVNNTTSTAIDFTHFENNILTNTDSSINLDEDSAISKPTNNDIEPVDNTVSTGFFHDLGDGIPELDSMLSGSSSPTNTSPIDLNTPVIEPKVQPQPIQPINKTVNTTIGRQYRAEEVATNKSINNHLLPSLELLNEAPLQKDAYSEDDLVRMSLTLENALQQYNVSATVMNVSPGPVITRFEIELAPGVQAKKIT